MCGDTPGGSQASARRVGHGSVTAGMWISRTSLLICRGASPSGLARIATREAQERSRPCSSWRQPFGAGEDRNRGGVPVPGKPGVPVAPALRGWRGSQPHPHRGPREHPHRWRQPFGAGEDRNALVALGLVLLSRWRQPFGAGEDRNQLLRADLGKLDLVAPALRGWRGSQRGSDAVRVQEVHRVAPALRGWRGSQRVQPDRFPLGAALWRQPFGAGAGRNRPAGQ